MGVAEDAVMAFIDGDLATGEGFAPFRVFLDYPEQIDLFGGQSKGGAIVAKPVITYATLAPGRELVRTDQVTINGTAYGVQNIRKIRDGAESTAELAKV